MPHQPRPPKTGAANAVRESQSQPKQKRTSEATPRAASRPAEPQLNKTKGARVAIEANADAKYEQKVTTLQAHGLFAKGPYIIMGLLASILVTFCCCAFSTRPSSMSNKYDMN